MSESIVHVAAPDQPRRSGYEWRTTATLFGLPLIHIAWGRDANRKRLTARGIIAIGQYATGGLVIAQFGAGIICISQFGVGVLALSQFAVGLAVITQIGAAAVGIFQFGACFDGIGQGLFKLKELI